MRRLNAVTNRKQVLKVVKELDAFPKVEDDYKETTASGGGVSIATFIVIIILVMSEVAYYATTELKFDYAVDTEMEGKLKINIDMTVAMKCAWIGADVLDLSGQDTSFYGELNLDNVHFDLSPNQRRYHMLIVEINSYLREQYHAIQDLMWMSREASSYRRGMPEREDKPDKETDACRIHGTLDVKKVAGNFHVTAGKKIMTSKGHAHLAAFVENADYNYSHRIDHFSFGDIVSGVVSPLDGEEKVTKDNFHMFQYFMQVVPTEVRTYKANVNTYQYAVTERNRSIDHSKGSHGVPGIFVKYDLNSLKIRVKEQHRSIWQFLVRLCGIIGGVFAVSGMMHGIVGFLVDVFCCRYKIGKYKFKDIDDQKLNSDLNTQTLTENLNSENIPGVGLLSSES